jgi:hypothetical protein
MIEAAIKYSVRFETIYHSSEDLARFLTAIG